MVTADKAGHADIRQVHEKESLNTTQPLQASDRQYINKSDVMSKNNMNGKSTNQGVEDNHNQRKKRNLGNSSSIKTYT